MTPSQVVVEMVRSYWRGAWYCTETPNQLLVEFFCSDEAMIDSDGVCRFDGKPIEDFRTERFVAWLRLHYPEAVDFEANSERRRQELRLTPEQRAEMLKGVIAR